MIFKRDEDRKNVALFSVEGVLRRVADGVGGWRQWGVDPGVFAESLMRACDRLVSAGRFTPRKPAAILAAAYQELTQEKRHIIGSSTACVIALDRERGWLYAANIGDSGFRVVRNGAFIHRSQEQQHYFNTPFQLSLPPPGSRANILSDSPERADTTELKVEPGDVILLCSDGVLDNVPESLLLPQLASLVHTDPDPCLLQKTANSIALQARSLAFDSNFLSPFAMAARKNGIAANGED
ncbi:unnamed protein product [Darwinula stevensoni]|uniref:Protein phosphatase n=1 Tax=Darwinula stevensoni TaxID=69355 RepID=A0A7R9FN80_9CRUS|nr:unnamed protein product [Darwinula stevensoni]CAG0896491.1 unnamed protein product [Darwinula stevensoni]